MASTENIDRGLVTSLVTADTSKAFDSVEHGRLLDKLGWYGIEPDWFSAWLRGRTQTVRGGSEALDVTHGVVQGSILGPVLFLLFTNDFPQHVSGGKVIMYADDTQFLDADYPLNIQALKSRVENSLSVALKWFVQNRLKINPAKTEMVTLRSRRLHVENFSVYFGDDKISPSDSVRVLGVTIDSHLTWVDHISSIVRRCYCVLVGLARMRHKLPKCTRRLLVEALVFPHLRYCVNVWGSCTANQKQRVQKVINFGVRIVTGLGRRDHVTPALRELGWCKVDELITERDIATVPLINAPCASELLRERVVLRSEVSSRSTRARQLPASCSCPGCALSSPDVALCTGQCTHGMSSPRMRDSENTGVYHLEKRSDNWVKNECHLHIHSFYCIMLLSIFRVTCYIFYCKHTVDFNLFFAFLTINM